MKKLVLRIATLWKALASEFTTQPVQLRPVPVRVHRAQRWRRR